MKEKKTWILVAHRVGARLYQRTSGKEKLELLRKIENPKGKIKSKSIYSDRPGRAAVSRSNRRFSYSVERKPEKEAEKKFAKQLASVVNKGALGKKFDKLMLIAGPHILGLIRDALNKPSSSKVVKEVRSDLGRLNKSSLERRLKRI